MQTRKAAPQDLSHTTYPGSARHQDSDTFVTPAPPSFKSRHLHRTNALPQKQSNRHGQTRQEHARDTRTATHAAPKHKHTHPRKHKHASTRISQHIHPVHAPGTCPSRPPAASAARRGPPRRTAETRTPCHRRRLRSRKSRQPHSRSPRRQAARQRTGAVAGAVAATGDRFRVTLGGAGRPAALPPEQFRVRHKRARRPVRLVYICERM